MKKFLVLTFSMFFLATCSWGHSAIPGTVTSTADGSKPLDCPPPSGLTATSLTNNSANLSWTAGGTETAWEYVYGLSPLSPPSGSGTATSSGTVNPISGLSANMTYQYYVRANCGSEFSTWAGPMTFTTPCANSSLPVSEGFNAATMPACWSQQFQTGTLPFTFPATGTGIPAPAPQEGTNQVMFNSYNNDGSQTRLVSPPITTTGVPSVDVQFYWYFSLNGGSGTYLTEGVQLQYSTDGTTWTDAGSLIRRYGNITGWSLQTLTLPAGAGNQATVYVGFLFTSNAGYDSYLDAVSIDETPACQAPTVPVANNITQTSADLGWTSAATAWEYQYGPAGYTPTATGTATTSNPASISGLSAGTTYDFYVRSDCSGTYSTWSAKGTFTTLCDVQNPPLTQNFDGVTAPALPNCWTVETNTVEWRTTDETGYFQPAAHSPHNAISTFYSSYDAKDDWFFTPGLNLTAAVTYKLSFWYLSDGGSYPEKMEVKYGSAATSAAMTAGALWNNSNMTNGTYLEAVIYFSPASTGVFYIGWHAYSDADMDFLTVDDISVTAVTSWTGSVNSDWGTALNWNPAAVPNSSTDAIIPSVTNLPVVNEAPGSPANCSNLTIDNLASVTIAAGKALTVNGSLTNNAGSSGLVIKSDASGTGSLIDNGTITGPAQVERYLSPIAWHYISSPISDALAGIFTNDYLMTSDPTTSTGWGPWIISVTDPLQVMRGYAVWKPASNPGLEAFSGTLNTGTETFTGDRTGTDTWAGWHLAGNPYPSSINLLSGISWDNFEPNAWFWDPVANNYVAYPTQGGYGTHSQYVPPEQGFYVHIIDTYSGSSTLTITNASRIHSVVPFLKDVQVVTNGLLIAVSSGVNNYSDKITVQFNPNATASYDPGYDAYKLQGLAEAPQLYTKIGDTNVSCNSLPFAGRTTVIPMGFTCGGNGQFTLKADSIKTFESNISIVLEDLKLNTQQDLRLNSSYTFMYDTLDNANRFLLHFYNPSFGIGEQHIERAVQIYSFGDNLYIKSLDGTLLRGNVTVYDLLGKDIFHNQLTNSTLNRYTPGVRNGYYFVRVVTDEGTYNGKVFLR